MKQKEKRKMKQKIWFHQIFDFIWSQSKNTKKDQQYSVNKLY